MVALLIDPKHEPMLGAALITILIFGFYAFFRPSSKFTRKTLSKRIYRPHKKWKYMCHAFMIMIFFTTLGLILRRPNFSFDVDSLLIPGFFFGGFFFISILSLQNLRGSYIELFDSELRTKYGRKENRISYDQVVDAYYHYGYLHIVLLEKNRKGMHREIRMPAIFTDMGALVENIRQRATAANIHS